MPSRSPALPFRQPHRLYTEPDGFLAIRGLLLDRRCELTVMISRKARHRGAAQRAPTNAVILTWDSGVLEGSSTRTKLIKRQMYCQH
jgi:hypothetical protein